MPCLPRPGAANESVVTSDRILKVSRIIADLENSDEI
jgi:predicted ATPase with chaperone activity